MSTNQANEKLSRTNLQSWPLIGPDPKCGACHVETRLSAEGASFPPAPNSSESIAIQARQLLFCSAEHRSDHGFHFLQQQGPCRCCCCIQQFQAQGHRGQGRYESTAALGREIVSSILLLLTTISIANYVQSTQDSR